VTRFVYRCMRGDGDDLVAAASTQGITDALTLRQEVLRVVKRRS